MTSPKIFIAGHNGMVGSALIRHLKKQEVEIITKDKRELDLLNQDNVQIFFKNEKIDQVYLAAAKVGGIHANNTYPADFIYQNLMIQTNVGAWILAEIKHSEYFKKGGQCKFNGHGLTIWQKDKRLEFQKETGIRVLLVIVEKGHEGKIIYQQFLDILEEGVFFDTKGKTKCRIYPLKNFKKVLNY